eukprot:TRINITY_DN5101_c0_g1_i1.p1 TRINITY_DN5101_c0_g1~~TRINITY_DN5101_c0_g1_i1.p1  ORF type:complete len:359 (-),score=62.18 TRINITY_DN5101_c0_g1_i1:570-1646(-)
MSVWVDDANPEDEFSLFIQEPVPKSVLEKRFTEEASSSQDAESGRESSVVQIAGQRKGAEVKAKEETEADVTSFASARRSTRRRSWAAPETARQSVLASLLGVASVSPWNREDREARAEARRSLSKDDAERDSEGAEHDKSAGGHRGEADRVHAMGNGGVEEGISTVARQRVNRRVSHPQSSNEGALDGGSERAQEGGGKRGGGGRRRRSSMSAVTVDVDGLEGSQERVGPASWLWTPRSPREGGRSSIERRRSLERRHSGPIADSDLLGAEEDRDTLRPFRGRRVDDAMALLCMGGEMAPTPASTKNRTGSSSKVAWIYRKLVASKKRTQESIQSADGSTSPTDEDFAHAGCIPGWR